MPSYASFGRPIWCFAPDYGYGGPLDAGLRADAAPPAQDDPEARLDDELFRMRLNQMEELSNLATTPPPPPLKPAEVVSTADVDLRRQYEEVRNENLQLRQSVEQARGRLASLEKEAELWRAREQEYENMLEEKSELIRQLHVKLNEIPKRNSDLPSEEELVALHQELQRERQEFEQERSDMENQFKQMEISLAKERADIARQRSEANRLQSEIKRQIEMLEREAKTKDSNAVRSLRDEVLGRKPSGQTGRPTPPSGTAQTPTQPLPSLQDRKAPEGEGGSGRKSLFGRLFGGNTPQQ
jgi:hypothetical protein